MERQRSPRAQAVPQRGRSRSAAPSCLGWFCLADRERLRASYGGPVGVCLLRASSRRDRGHGGRGRGVKIAVLSPVWFPVPPAGYGGIEWIVSLLADGLADTGHDVTLFASGDSQTRARLHAVYPVAPSEWIRAHVLGAAPCGFVSRAGRRVRGHLGSHGLARARAGIAGPDAGRAHRARPALGRAGRPVRTSRSDGSARGAHLDLRPAAPPETRPAVDRDVRERARSLRLSVQTGARRLSPVPRTHDGRQGSPPGDRRRDRERPPAQTRRKVSRAARARILRPARPAPPERNHRVCRRGISR